MTYEHALLLVRSPEETPFHIGNYDFETRAEGIKKVASKQNPAGGRGVQENGHVEEAEALTISHLRPTYVYTSLCLGGLELRLPPTFVTPSPG